MEYLNNFLKEISKLPIIFKIVLLPVLFILWLILWVFPRLLLIILFVIALCCKQQIKPFIERFVDQKNQGINQALNKIEKIYELQLQIGFNNDCKDIDSSILLQTQQDLEKAAEISDFE